jgi:hypothetical protein
MACHKTHKHTADLRGHMEWRVSCVRACLLACLFVCVCVGMCTCAQEWPSALACVRARGTVASNSKPNDLQTSRARASIRSMSVPKAFASSSRCCASCERAANTPFRASLLSSEQVVMLSRKAPLSAPSHSACHERPPSPTVVAPRPTSNVTGGLDSTIRVPGVSMLAACRGLRRRRLLLRGTTEDSDMVPRQYILNTATQNTDISHG